MATVLIAGCGVTGPVLALLLRQKGYKPVIVERVKKLGDAGLSLGLFPNGMKVLSATGLKDVGGVPLRLGTEYSSDGEMLGDWDMSYLQEQYGEAARMVRRSTLSRVLTEEVMAKGIPIHLGWELDEVRESDDGIVAVSKDGRELSASFLVGCDGLHSATRKWVLERHGKAELPADSTGLVMIGGFSPRHPSSEPGHPVTWYGTAKFGLNFQVDAETDTSVWGLVLPEPPHTTKESWAQEDTTDIPHQTQIILDELQGWPEQLTTTIKNTTKLVRFGLYDRPELPPQQWFFHRCVLLGDAAHPTSPHVGQGANQSLEDCWHLYDLLPSLLSSSSSDTPTTTSTAQATPTTPSKLSTSELEQIFQTYASKRQPRTAVMVKQARMQGELRVNRNGEQACRQRNEVVKKMWADADAVKTRMHDVYKEPFQI